MPLSPGGTTMGVRATFESLHVHLSPSLGQAKRCKARGDDASDSFSCRGPGEQKGSGTSSASIRTHANTRPAFELNHSAPRFHNLSPPLPTIATSLLDVSADAFGAQYDVNHIYHYLASVESDLLQQAQSVTVRSAFPTLSLPTSTSRDAFTRLCPRSPMSSMLTHLAHLTGPVRPTVAKARRTLSCGTHASGRAG